MNLHSNVRGWFQKRYEQRRSGREGKERKGVSGGDKERRFYRGQILGVSLRVRHRVLNRFEIIFTILGPVKADSREQSSTCRLPHPNASSTWCRLPATCADLETPGNWPTRGASRAGSTRTWSTVRRRQRPGTAPRDG